MKAWWLVVALLAGGDARRDGFQDLSPALQALQRDDSQNPALLWVEQGAERFAAECARCHTAASLRGVAARYPAFDADAGRVLDLAGRINRCRKPAAPWPAEHDALLALSSYLARQSNGEPIRPPEHPDLRAAEAAGERWFRAPLGQLQISCAQCHDGLAGRRLAGSVIPQAHPTGYPIYRLEWQGMGSLQRRLRGCMTGVRAEPFAPDDPAWVQLEAYLKRRAEDMPIDAPGVRP